MSWQTKNSSGIAIRQPEDGRWHEGASSTNDPSAPGSLSSHDTMSLPLLQVTPETPNETWETGSCNDTGSEDCEEPVAPRQWTNESQLNRPAQVPIATKDCGRTRTKEKGKAKNKKQKLADKRKGSDKSMPGKEIAQKSCGKQTSVASLISAASTAAERGSVTAMGTTEDADISRTRQQH